MNQTVRQSAATKGPEALRGLDSQLVDAEVDSVPQPRPPEPKSRAARIVLGASLVLIAFNLRSLFSSLSVLLPEVMHETGMSTTGASLLTTLPVLCLGLFAPLAPSLAQRHGAERTLLGALVLLVLGTGLRAFDSVPVLFAATFVAGGAIAIGNVLLPGVVKRDFPDRVALMTGLYTMALCAGSAAAAGLTLPIEHLVTGSWRGALGAWAVPALIVLLIWTPQALASRRQEGHRGFRVVGLWRDRLAWQVTLFMGLQSALAYCIFGWLAPILRERGFDAVTAGFIVSVSVMTQVVTCLAVPSIAVRLKNQRGINVALVVAAVVALLGILFAPTSTVLFWAVLQGIGQGGLIAAAMTLIVLRSPDSHVAAHLSGMAQGVGYVLAAFGPLFVGLIRGWTGSFSETAFLFVALGLGAAIMGVGAGRALHVGARAIPVDA
ncbi:MULTISPECIES: MFS transporter [unclassified Mesorhizobium]|uniref:CynX/NimT family MFS transporter n=1 Tax=unclassified Mesorhizobium TaxID=325217 RepID=UPI00086AE5B7|nr:MULTISPECIES: MFS transporter [unclassified Mesorhizobium]MBN9258000.1 MFS transporter [Mesorhizobium sp.]ODT17083.1 MAG: MFS transporter [Mesorhizobium sp. SCN 65-12]OJX82678.1 MAG: cyanate transporter [Mesorhizobium sp. 65-26]